MNEAQFVHVIGVTLNALDGLNDVPEVVWQALSAEGPKNVEIVDCH